MPSSLPVLRAAAQCCLHLAFRRELQNGRVHTHTHTHKPALCPPPPHTPRRRAMSHSLPPPTPAPPSPPSREQACSLWCWKSWHADSRMVCPIVRQDMTVYHLTVCANSHHNYTLLLHNPSSFVPICLNGRV